MNLFTLKLLPLYYVLMLSIIYINVFNYINDKITPIEMCSFEEGSHIRQPFYVEDVTTNPILFHISEPIRITLKVNASIKEVNQFKNKWISLYTLEDASICFMVNDIQTKYMKKRSEYLQKHLQKRMYAQ